jgi:dihydrofolate reductase
MRGIYAVNNLGYIGLNDGLPWRSKADFKHFKEKTMGARLIVGYNTYQTLPPLKGREIVLYERGMDLEGIDWCIGGKKTYEELCHLFTELHISYIDDNSIGDTMLPDLRNLNPDCKVFKYSFGVD